MQELGVESKSNKRVRGVAISHPGQQMAEDVKKEATIEESVMEPTKELRESKKVLCRMKEAHEREITKFAFKSKHSDTKRLVEEVSSICERSEQLQLERRARST